MYIFASILIVLIGAAIAFFIQRGFLVREMKSLFLTLASQILKNSNEEFLTLARQKFEAEQQKGIGELELRRKEITLVVSELEKRLAAYEELVRSFEKERDTKYGSLEEQMKGSVEITQKLQQSTDRLTSILGNVKLRGQWGERMAEDILAYAGLRENIQYIKNKAQETSATRPDYTFILPDGHKVNMDVKFPLAKYLKLKNTHNEDEQKTLTQEFIRDVRARIKEVQSKDYINPANNTLEYVILFIPNEQVYGFIHEAEPGLLDETLKKKVILSSPSTLYAMLAVIRQSYDNFYLTRATHDIIKVINEFTKRYENFQKRFEDLGGLIDKIRGKYDEITTTSYKMLDANLRKIDQYKKGEAATEGKQSNAYVRSRGDESDADATILYEATEGEETFEEIIE